MLPAAGGSPVTLASGMPGCPFGGLAVSGGNIYWLEYSYQSNQMSIARLPLGGGTPVTLASTPDDIKGIAVSSTSVFWTDSQAGAIVSVPLAGGLPQTLVSGLYQPQAIAANDAAVYWTTPTAIMSLALP
jgi:hypothetical protein